MNGNTLKAGCGFSILLLVAAGLAGCDTGPTAAGGLSPEEEALSQAQGGGLERIPVSGSGVAFASTAIIHSEEPTATGMIQRSTSIIELAGDLTGYVLFHPTSEFDFAGGTLVNTGTQIFSGTVLGSGPVILHDDTFRFDVDLATGETLGTGRFSRSHDAPHKGGWYECDLIVVGTGATPEGNFTSDYTGTCTRRGNLR